MHAVHATAAPGVRIDVRLPEGSPAQVVLGGELDLSTIAPVREAVRALWAAGHGEVRLDLRELTFMDSSGVHLIRDLQTTAESTGRRLSVLEAEGPARRVLLLTGMRRHLPVESA